MTRDLRGGLGVAVDLEGKRPVLLEVIRRSVARSAGNPWPQLLPGRRGSRGPSPSVCPTVQLWDCSTFVWSLSSPPGGRGGRGRHLRDFVATVNLAACIFLLSESAPHQGRRDQGPSGNTGEGGAGFMAELFGIPELVGQSTSPKITGSKDRLGQDSTAPRRPAHGLRRAHG